MKFIVVKEIYCNVNCISSNIFYPWVGEKYVDEQRNYFPILRVMSFQDLIRFMDSGKMIQYLLESRNKAFKRVVMVELL